MDPDLELLKAQMADVKIALGNVALAVDDNPWASTHAELLAGIRSVGDAQTRKVLEEFLQVVGILNMKMVGIFSALKPVTPILDPEFLRMIAAEKEFVLTSPNAQQDRAAAIAVLADALREVAAKHYKAFVGNTATSVAGDMEAVIESLR